MRCSRINITRNCWESLLREGTSEVHLRMRKRQRHTWHEGNYLACTFHLYGDLLFLGSALTGLGGNSSRSSCIFIGLSRS